MPTETRQIPISSQRQEKVKKACEGWIARLIDLSRRNNLLYYRHLKTGTLDLATADPDLLADLLDGGTGIPIKKLFSGSRDESLVGRVRDIARRAKANEEEKGLQTLYVALGVATWTATDGGRAAESPILLRPVTLTTTGSESFSISAVGEVQANLVLVHFLDTQFGVHVDAEELLEQISSDDENNTFDPAGAYTALCELGREIPGFEVKPSFILGNFAFQKMAMVRDLRERGAELAANDLIAAIAGDQDARALLSSSQREVEASELDRIPPENEFIVLDADSSQQCAIANVLSGQSAVIHGPPGTGKSQTIANLVATLAATGHKVLFVAEKRAALEVVLRRLKKVGLEHLAIDLHGADLSPRKVMQKVADALERVRHAVPVETEGLHKQFADRRARLNRHVDRLHTKRNPTGKSVYEMQGRLLRLGNSFRTSVRWRGEELRRLTRELAEDVQRLLAEAGGFQPLFLRVDRSPWTGANLPSGDEVLAAMDLVSRAGNQSFPKFMAALNQLTVHSCLNWPASVQAAQELVRMVEESQSLFMVYRADVFETDLDELIRNLEPGRHGGLTSAFAWLRKPVYRRARLAARSMRSAGPQSVPIILAELEKVKTVKRDWAQHSKDGGIPRPVEGFATLIQEIEPLFGDINELRAMLSDFRTLQMTLDETGALLGTLVADDSTPHKIPKLMEIESRLRVAGVASLVDEIRGKKPSTERWPQIFEYAWLASALDDASISDPEVKGFVGSTHNGTVADFVRCDKGRIALSAERVRRAHGERAIEAMNAHPEQQSFVMSQAAKTRYHRPLRKAFAEAAEVLTAVCPCWMASPLSVSQLLDCQQRFDFVIFDEASQVLPEDAVAALMRGKHLVVAGDNEQLPPTNFFAYDDADNPTDEEEAGPAEGFESLLNMMMPFVKSCYLDWHYRSQDESLINFANYHIYHGRLVTFPGCGGSQGIQHVLVGPPPGHDGQENSSSAEALRVVELILQHAREDPGQTLGVITMGIPHMNKLQAALDRELPKHPDLTTFFDPSNDERFFIKNLERVQGDERDAIIISVGYGKDAGGNLPLTTFGPLQRSGGRRRLNVAITRARQRITVVSSFSYTDIDLTSVRPGTGVELLRDYLLYAATNGKRFGDGYQTPTPLNDFEADVFDTLKTQGIELIPQVGASRFRIDMAAMHPNQPGRFVLAIECDGASYHSSYTARDRDRLRQQQLENLGWRFHRIWSTDWFLQKEIEVRRAVDAFKAAVRRADEGGVVDDLQGDVPPANDAPPVQDIQRGPRPAVPYRRTIDQYSDAELALLILWVKSDGKLRTDDEVVSEMVGVLGFTRRGTRIKAAIRNALDLYRSVVKGT